MLIVSGAMHPAQQRVKPTVDQSLLLYSYSSSILSLPAATISAMHTAPSTMDRGTIQSKCNGFIFNAPS